MALTRNNGQWVGVLADNTPSTADEDFCAAYYDGFVCTQREHSDRYPHLAGDSRKIVALWWDNETTGGCTVSEVDTAAYQLGELAKELTSLSECVNGTSAYKEAYRAALSDVAAGMGLTTVPAFRYP